MNTTTNLAPHQRRAVEEKAQLDERITKLTAFMGTQTFQALDSSEHFDLHDQLNCMERYAAALGRRITRFQGDPA